MTPDSKKRVHFLGINGSGASSTAAIAKSFGFEISGCDTELPDQLGKNLNVLDLHKGHSKTHLDNTDILAFTPAILSSDPDNEELASAEEKGLEVITWQEFLGKYLLQDKFVIAVSGTHGKSTTTAMIGCLLEDAGLDPTVELGARVMKWDSNFRIGQGKYFVIEADEFNDNFLNYTPEISVVTNIDTDHLEYFRDLDHIKDSFEHFLSKTRQTVIANLEDPNTAEVIKWTMKREHSPRVLDFNKIDTRFDLKIPGEFNIKNAKAVFQTGLLLGLEPAKILDSLNNFGGISRRFEYLGKVNGAPVYSDFAHHPEEVSKTMQAAQNKYPDKKITLIFQPHLYSRTKTLFNQFTDTFSSMPVDKAVILDIYGSREKDPGDIHSGALADSVSNDLVSYSSDPENTFNQIRSTLTDEDVVIFMGAGDVDKFAREFVQK